MVAGVRVDSVWLEGSCKAREACEGVGGAAPGDLEREPYSCERLNHIRGGYTPLTIPQPVLSFDFSRPQVS